MAAAAQSAPHSENPAGTPELNCASRARSRPRVSVLMSVHNGQAYLREAIDSILNQTLSDFEFIVVDDASTDATAEILANYDDPRLRLIHNRERLGLPRALNTGLASTEAELIARIDADDACEPERLERQLAFMDARPDIAVLGTWVLFVKPDGSPLYSWTPALPTAGVLFWEMTWMNPLVHPSLMVRRKCFLQSGGYSAHYIYAQDYDFLTRTVRSGGKLAMLPEVLVRYRCHPGQISEAKRSRQEALAFEITRRHLRWLLAVEVPDQDLREMLRLFHGAGRFASFSEASSGVKLALKVLRRCEPYCEPQEIQHIRSRLVGILKTKSRNSLSHSPLAAARALLSGIALKLSRMPAPAPA